MHIYKKKEPTKSQIEKGEQLRRTLTDKRNPMVRLIFRLMLYIKFQDSSSNHLSAYASVTDGQTDGQAQINMPPQHLRSWGIKKKERNTSKRLYSLISYNLLLEANTLYNRGSCYKLALVYKPLTDMYSLCLFWSS